MRFKYRLSHVALLSVLVCGLVTLISCTPLPFGPPRLRLTNTSPVDLDRVVVIFPNEQLVFGPLPAGATTAYQPVKQGVYGYAAYELTLDGRIVRQPVIDWMGEQPLAGTRFTYVLSVDPQRAEWEIVKSEVQTD